MLESTCPAVRDDECHRETIAWAAGGLASLALRTSRHVAPPARTGTAWAQKQHVATANPQNLLYPRRLAARLTDG